MKEAVSSVSIACFLYVVYTYSASFFWALETVGFLGLWLVISVLVLAPFTAVFGGYLWVIEWQKNNDHRRDIEWRKAQIDELKIVTEAQKKTPVLAGGERPKLSTVEPVILPPPMRSILDDTPTMKYAVIVGGQGAGKSNLMKWVVSDWKKNNYKISIVDPHSPSEICGIKTIGSGNNYDEIEDFMLTLLADVKRQYRTGDTAQNGDLGDRNHKIYFDEFSLILEKIPEVGERFVSSMLSEFRKAGIHWFINTQSERAAAIGGKGYMDKWDDVYKLRLSYDEVLNNERRCWVSKFNAKKENWQERALPPEFNGLVHLEPYQIVAPTTHPLTKTEKALILAYHSAPKKMTQNGLVRYAGVGKGDSSMKFAKTLLNGDFQPFVGGA